MSPARRSRRSIDHALQAALLFDIDGTLIDCAPLFEKAFTEALRQVGVPINEKNRRKVSDNLKSILAGKVTRTTELRLIWKIGKILGLSYLKRIKLILISYEELKKAYNLAPPIKGAREAISSLKRRPNIKLGIVTARTKKDTLKKLEETELLDFFDIIVTREDVKFLKPSPDQTLMAAKMLRMSPRACVMIGDMPTDIIAGKRAGAVTVAVQTGFFKDSLVNQGPDLIVESVKDIPTCLKEILKRVKEN